MRGVSFVALIVIVLLLNTSTSVALEPLTVGVNWELETINGGLLTEEVVDIFHDGQQSVVQLVTERPYPFPLYQMYRFFNATNASDIISAELLLNITVIPSGYLYMTPTGVIPLYHDHSVDGTIELNLIDKDFNESQTILVLDRNYALNTSANQMSFVLVGSAEEVFYNDTASSLQVAQIYEWQEGHRLTFDYELSIFYDPPGNVFVEYEYATVHLKIVNTTSAEEILLTHEVWNSDEVMFNQIVVDRNDTPVVTENLNYNNGWGFEPLFLEQFFNKNMPYPFEIVQIEGLPESGIVDVYYQNTDANTQVSTPLGPNTPPAVVFLIVFGLVVFVVFLLYIARSDKNQMRRRQSEQTIIRSPTKPPKRPKRDSVENLQRMIENRECCKINGSQGKQFCSICGRIVPKDWIVE